MAKIRAYKIAEELGIDRNDLVEKAKSVGVELVSPMASIEDDVANELRHKLGGLVPGAQVIERRVEGQSGGAVIRRRKRAPEPAPVVVAEPAPAAVPPAAAEPVAPEPEEVEEPALPARVEPEPAPVEEPAPIDVVAHGVAEAAREAQREGLAQEPRSGGPDFGAAGAAAAAAAKGKERKRVREVVNLREQEQLARQATSRLTRRPVAIDPRAMQSPRRRRRDKLAPAASRPAAAAAAPKAGKRVVRAEGLISVAELARQLGAKAAEVQGRLMALGTMASVNQQLDLETAGRVAAHYGFEVQDVGFQEAEVLGEATPVAEGAGAPRPPIVTVMGHVDHGKTSLLDALREANVVAGEAGGITQHIGAYQVQKGERKLTFIDTPGHEAFTTMRARGAQVTDIVVLVVAASEGIMPQTVEAIEHAKAAEVPIVVAVNKVDLPDANPQLVRQRLMEHGLVPEDFGGDTICVNVSATKRTGLDQLLEMLALQSDVLELRADPERRARGIVLESRLDKGRGPVATLLVQDGTLHQGDAIVVGTAFGRVRAMENERGQRVDTAGPSTPVQVIGLSDVPEAGAPLYAVENERAAREVAEHRAGEEKARPVAAQRRVSLEELFARGDDSGPKELRVVLKADVHGSLEAVRDALVKQSTDSVKVNVILAGVGAISESDVMLAKASDAIVVGFHVRPDSAARRAAEGQGVDIRSYQIIYEVTDEVRKAMAGLLPPKIEEKVLGRVEVRKTFSVPRVGTVAGCYVLEGSVKRTARARLLRDGVQIWEGTLASLKRFKDDAREVQAGYECGIGLEGYNDVKIGDVIEPYEVVETPAELS
ncbi:MAG: translation initiation factor IF-2 [Deltaproteobacteria bacterium]|nr:translation initiation factor IF-2 [Deltaproteobacteria bacterium]